MGSMTDTPNQPDPGCGHAFTQPQIVESLGDDFGRVFIHDVPEPQLVTAMDAWALSSYWTRVAQMLEAGESGEVQTP